MFNIREPFIYKFTEIIIIILQNRARALNVEHINKSILTSCCQLQFTEQYFKSGINLLCYELLRFQILNLQTRGD
jgi:hypothetical protein